MKEKSPRLISRSEGIVNLEMPFAELRDFVTPNESFYVRCHFPIPEISVANWSLRIEGEVEKPCALTYEELKEFPQHTLTATVECAGNGRSWLEPKAKGVQWDLGAVGNAKWSGVWLRDVMQRAGIRRNAIEVILEGADRGDAKETPKPPEAINYARSLPLGKAKNDVLLAWQMNGEPLTAAHGFPLRAIVPGWFGMAAVKWLQRLIVTAEPFHGYYQSTDYAYWQRREGLPPSMHSLGEMAVKAQIAQPVKGESIAAGKNYRVHGAAWSGDTALEKVELSFDAGKNWSRARLLGEPVKHAWRLWEFDWQTPAQPGRVTLCARATDATGRTQPAQRIQDYGTYVINHLLPVEVDVR